MLVHMTQNAPVTPASLRAAAEAKLRPLGERRRRLMAELEALDAELLPVLRESVAVEVPIRRIAEITGLAYNTVRQRGKAPAE
jgi:hypothetical protein